MPAASERQRRFMGAELARKRAGKKTRTGMSASQLKDYASKPTSRMVHGMELSPHGDLGKARQEEAKALGTFKGVTIKACSVYFPQRPVRTAQDAPIKGLGA